MSVSRTIRLALTAGAALVLAAPATARPAVSQIEWSIDRDGSDASRVQLTIETRWSANDRSTWYR